MTNQPSPHLAESRSELQTANDGRPLVAGFYPDPSICRVGEDYFLVQSSFEYVPGVPIWHSTDLITWTQIGNVLDRPSQLTLAPMSEWLPGTPYGSDGEAVAAGTGSDGVYAPTIRHHDGVFYVTTTIANDFRRGPLVVHSTDPHGPWSEPVYVNGMSGIDSDLAWDDEGVCHMTLSTYESGQAHIVSAPIDLTTGELLAPPRCLWSGTGGVAPEAPHLFRRGRWWYLMLAEGGTAAGHRITIARSKTLYDDWEPCPGNPLLAHLGVSHPVQYTGHGDLVQTSAGEWAMVYLGVRLRGFPGFHVNGRETFLAGVDWIDDWPVVREATYPLPTPQHDFVDTFTLPLHPRWVAPADWAASTLEMSSNGARFRASDHRGIIGVRTRDALWQAELRMQTRDGCGGIVVRLDDTHFIQATACESTLVTEVRIGDVCIRENHSRPWPSTDVTFFARTVPANGAAVHIGPDRIEVGVISGADRTVLAECDGRHLSTEVAGGFTGRIVGVRVVTGELTLQEFAYSTIEH